MKISHHWLTQHLELSQSPQQVADLLTQIGLEVSHMTSHESFPSELIVGEVLSCLPHPNADKLRIAEVKMGATESKTIVCGAPNLAKGQKVIVAPVGSRLPLPNGGSLEIKARKIRGELSEGMICSAPELGFQGDADGIWVLDTKAAAGNTATQALDSPLDTIYDIELTPNRNDACSHLGVARDLAVLLHRKVKPLVNFSMIPEGALSIHASLKIPHDVPRYTGLVLDNIKIAPSPAWLQSALKSIGLSPINNVVDVTNYITHDLGQPLHAFDYDQIEEKKIIVRHLPKGTRFTTLDGITRKLNGEEIMICDPKKPLALGGIMGGKESSITRETSSIFLESAYFNPVNIAKTARHHRLHTDASYRFERGTDPELAYTALQKAAQMITQLTGSSIASCPLDLYPEKILPHSVEITYAYITEILGIAIPQATIDQILQRLDITIHKKDDRTLTLSIPLYRRDVTRPIDVVEEILRIYGYNHPSLNSILQKPYPTPKPPSPTQRLKKHIQNFFFVHGYYEIRNNPLIPEEHHATLKSLDPKKSVLLANPLHHAYTALPQTLLFGGLRTLHYNLNRQEHDLKFFEIAKTYAYAGNKVKEVEHLALWATGNKAPVMWRYPKDPYTLHDLQAILIQLLDSLGYAAPEIIHVEESGYQIATQLQLPNKASIACGRVRQAILDQMQIKQPVFFTQIPLSVLTDQPTITYREVPKYPYVTRDISLALPQDINYASLHATLQQLKIPQLRKFYLIDTYEGKSVGNQKSYTLRFVLQENDATLHEKKIAKIMGKITSLFEKKLGATIRV